MTEALRQEIAALMSRAGELAYAVLAGPILLTCSSRGRAISAHVRYVAGMRGLLLQVTVIHPVEKLAHRAALRDSSGGAPASDGPTWSRRSSSIG